MSNGPETEKEIRPRGFANLEEGKAYEENIVS